MNKKNIILGVIVIVLIAIITIFGKEVIEEKDLRITKLEKEISIKEKSLKELSLIIEKRSENTDIEITETKNADGSYTKTKKITKSKESFKDSKKLSIAKERELTIKQKDTKIIEKTKKITNQKRLRVGIGIDTNLIKELHLSYKLYSNLGLYTNIKETSGSIGIFIEF